MSTPQEPCYLHQHCGVWEGCPACADRARIRDLEALRDRIQALFNGALKSMGSMQDRILQLEQANAKLLAENKAMRASLDDDSICISADAAAYHVMNNRPVEYQVPGQPWLPAWHGMQVSANMKFRQMKLS